MLLETAMLTGQLLQAPIWVTCVAVPERMGLSRWRVPLRMHGDDACTVQRSAALYTSLTTGGVDHITLSVESFGG